MLSIGNEDIRNKYGLRDVNNDNELLAKLGDLQKNAHPDMGSEKTSDKFIELTNAIEQVKENINNSPILAPTNGDSLLPSETSSKLVETNNQLTEKTNAQLSLKESGSPVPYIDKIELVGTNQQLRNQVAELSNKIKKESESKTKHFEEKLSQNLNNSIRTFKTTNITPTYSAAGLTLVTSLILGAIWAAPDAIKNSAYLSKFIDITTPIFMIIWIVSLISIAILYIIYKLKSIEQQDFISWLNFQPLQNILLRAFIGRRGSKFSKDEFIFFLMNNINYSFAKKHQLIYADGSSRYSENDMELYYRRLIKENYGYTSSSRYIELLNLIKRLYRIIFPDSYAVNHELAQSIADTIISRTVDNGYLHKLNSGTLSEIYSKDRYDE